MLLYQWVVFGYWRAIGPFSQKLSEISLLLMIREKLNLLFINPHLALEICRSLRILVYTLKPGIFQWNYRKDFKDRGNANVNVMTSWRKENYDFKASHLQVGPSLPLTSSNSLFVLVSNRCGWARLVLKRVLQTMCNTVSFSNMPPCVIYLFHTNMPAGCHIC